MNLVIGKRYNIPVQSLEEASRVYCGLRDESGEGGSTWPSGRVGEYTVSYNGKVWLGKWSEGAQPVYAPFASR